MKRALFAVVTVLAACAFANSAFALISTPWGVSTLAEGGSQGCGAQAIYDTADGGKLSSSTTPSNPSIKDCATTILEGTTTKGERSAFGETAQQAVTSGGQTIASSDSAVSNLRTGGLHVAADNRSGYGALSETKLWDMLTFNVPGATSSTVTYVTLNFRINGTAQAADPAILFVLGSLQVGTSTPCDCTHGNDIQWGVNRTDIGPGAGFFTDNSCFVTWKVLSSSTSGLVAQGTVVLQGTIPTLGFVMDLFATPGFGGNPPAGSLENYTASMSVSVPAGVTYTSASGVFPKGITSPTPTPTATPATGTVVADLTTDWSDSKNPNASNPHGTWKYRQGTMNLPLVSDWNAAGLVGFPVAQPAWAPSNKARDFAPALFKARSVPSGADWQVGDILMDTVDSGNGNPSLGVGNFLFTDTHFSGKVDIAGHVWEGGMFDANRPQGWALLVNCSKMASGEMDCNYPFDRSHPQTFDVTGVALAPGDTVELDLFRESDAGTFLGSSMTIEKMPSPTPTPTPTKKQTPTPTPTKKRTPTPTRKPTATPTH